MRDRHTDWGIKTVRNKHTLSDNASATGLCEDLSVTTAVTGQCEHFKERKTVHMYTATDIRKHRHTYVHT